MSVPPGPYPFYPYDPSNLPVTDADMQAALSSYELLLPSQTGNSGKYLTTNGTAKSWATIDLSTKQDAAAFLTTLVGIGGTSGSGDIARVTSPVLVTPVASRYNLSASTNVSELSAGVVQIGTTAANALGSLACAAVNTTGFVSTSFGVRISGGTGLFLANSGSYNSGLYLQAIASNGKMRLANHGNTGGCHFDINTLDTLTLRNFTDTGAGNLACAAVTASGTGTHTFGTTNTVTMAAGALTASGIVQGASLRVGNSNGQIELSGTTINLANATALRIGSTLNIKSDGSFRNAADSADSSIACANVTASGTVRLGSYTVATLPSAAANTRARAFVTDSNLAFNSTNLGSTVTAGGSTLVPVFSNGTNWVIG